MTMRELLKARRNSAQPALAGGSVKPGVERSETPGTDPKNSLAREAGDSQYEFRGRFAGGVYFERHRFRVSATLHSRLHANAQLRVLKSILSKPAALCAKLICLWSLLVVASNITCAGVEHHLQTEPTRRAEKSRTTAVPSFVIQRQQRSQSKPPAPKPVTSVDSLAIVK